MRYAKLRPDAVSPEYKTGGASGFDLACVDSVVLRPGETKAIPTGLTFEVPEKFELQVRPRSGLSLKTNLMVVLGTVDSDYRGEVKIICRNIGKDIIGFDAGTRLAQGVVVPVRQCWLEEVDSVSSTERGANGFGSTGA